MFSSSFAGIFFFKERNVLPGLGHSNELISRDENLHCLFGATIYKNHVVNKLTREELLKIITGAVECECAFVDDCLQKPLSGMNSSSMKKYVKFVADSLLGMLGEPPHFNVSNPFPFMVKQAIEAGQGRTNFFERKTSEYAKLGGEVAFATDEDF